MTWPGPSDSNLQLVNFKKICTSGANFNPKTKWVAKKKMVGSLSKMYGKHPRPENLYAVYLFKRNTYSLLIQFNIVNVFSCR